MSSKKQKAVPFLPEVVTAYRGEHGKTWEVQTGSTKRGDAFTDFASHTMRIPSESSPTARVIRTHELTHARVSPNQSRQLEVVADRYGLDQQAIVAGEEFRVNAIVKLLGFDTDLLIDGSEKRAGEEYAKEGSVESHNALMNFGAGLSGTKAFRQLVAGVKAGGQPEWAKELQELQKALKKVVNRRLASDIGDTNLHPTTDTKTGESVEVPYGFLNYTTQCAKLIQTFYKAKIQPEAGQGSSGVDVPVGYREGQFAPLIFDETVKRNTPVKGHLHRRKKAMTTGKRVLYPQRSLTDPQKRVFGQKQRSTGGIVVIDCSGSMEINDNDLNEILDLAPSSLVLAYSHRPGTRGVPNAWVLADRGKRVKSLPNTANIGNGVDGPALEFAISKRKGKEPVIWVCDGQVTDGAKDHGSPALTKVVGSIIAKHGITQARDIAGAIELLKHPAKARSSKTVYGNVGVWLEGNVAGYKTPYH